MTGAKTLTQTLRPYQERGKEMLRNDSWRIRKKRSTVMVLPTGGGKTSISADIIGHAVDSDYCALFTAHRVELITQAALRLKQYGVHGSILRRKEEDLKNPVQVSSVQTISRRIEKLMRWAKGRRVLVFVDEAHRVMGASYRVVLAAIREVALSVVVVGLTATPYRLDGQGLDDVFDDIIEVTTPTFLFDHGQCPTCKREAMRSLTCCGAPIRPYLMRPLMYRINDPNLVGIATRAGDFDIDQTAKVMNQVRLVADMVKEYRKRADGLQSVAFAVNITHSKHIAEAFNSAGAHDTSYSTGPGHGIPCGHIDGTTDEDERSDILARLAIGKLKIVSNCGVLLEGWDSESDMERIFQDPKRYWDGKSYPPDYVPLCVSIDACPTNSMGRFFQGPIGRITRSHPKKQAAIYLGHAGNDHRHGIPDWHYGFDLSGFKRRGEKHISQKNAVSLVVCQNCTLQWPAGTQKCLLCGAEIGTKSKKIVTIAGELVEMDLDTAGKRPATAAEKEIKYIELMAEARKLHQRPGFADDNFRAIFGIPPSIEMKNRVYRQYGFQSYLPKGG